VARKPRLLRSAETHQSFNVRPISNGFIASHTMGGPDGFKNTETYHEKAPKISLGPAEVGRKKKAPPSAGNSVGELLNGQAGTRARRSRGEL
jgi:hypothetical protein